MPLTLIIRNAIAAERETLRGRLKILLRKMLFGKVIFLIVLIMQW